MNQELVRGVNAIISSLPSEEKGQLSDGYHTFDELYKHRCTLYAALCRLIANHPRNKEGDNEVWMTNYHSDGSSYDGWFLLGIGKMKGNQITYHLPMSMHKQCSDFAVQIERAYEFDGHTSEDVLKRLVDLVWLLDY